MVLGSLGFALASIPAVEIGWKNDRARVVTTPPEGFEISADAPADLSLRWADRELQLHGFGSEVTGGVPLGDLRGEAVEGELFVQLCDKSSGVCTPGRFAIQGAIPDLKKGTARLMVEEAHEATHAEPVFNTDAAAVAEGAFERARAEGDLVLLDFSAVWCPPCNLLAAEVLHAADAEEILDGFQVAMVDVDHRSSWALKDRYHVGGYPTVVVVDAEGKELDRVEGYPGRDAFLAFLAGANEEKRDWTTADPATLGPAEVAEGLWALVRADAEAEALAPWLEASAESDHVEAHLARMRIEPSVAEADWLASNAPDRTLDWLPYVGDWSDGAEGGAALKRAIQAALTEADGFEAADLLYFAAQLAEDAEKPLIYGAAYATLSASLSGDDMLDRAHWTFLAGLRASAGDVDGAVAFLDGLTRTHPDDPTFLLKAADVLTEAGRYEESLKRSELALARSWGDIQLRAAIVHCKALKELDRTEEARSTAQKVLEAEQPPEDGLDVRTHKYRQKLMVFAEG